MFLPFPSYSTYSSNRYRQRRQDHRVPIGWLSPRPRQRHTSLYVGIKTSAGFIEPMHSGASRYARTQTNQYYKDVQRPTLTFFQVQHHFKVATLTYKVLQSGEPSYLWSITNVGAPRRALRSSVDTRRFAVLQSKIKIGSPAFRYSATSIWNDLHPRRR